MLPTIATLKLPLEEDGTAVLTEAEYDVLCNEASIAAAESGADRELDFDLESFTLNWINTHLGTDNWYSQSSEPDDGYDYDRYY